MMDTAGVYFELIKPGVAGANPHVAKAIFEERAHPLARKLAAGRQITGDPTEFLTLRIEHANALVGTNPDDAGCIFKKCPHKIIVQCVRLVGLRRIKLKLGPVAVNAINTLKSSNPEVSVAVVGDVVDAIVAKARSIGVVGLQVFDGKILQIHHIKSSTVGSNPQLPFSILVKRLDKVVTQTSLLFRLVTKYAESIAGAVHQAEAIFGGNPKPPHAVFE